MKPNYLFNRDTIVSNLSTLRKFILPLLIAHPVAFGVFKHFIFLGHQAKQTHQAPKGYLCV